MNQFYLQIPWKFIKAGIRTLNDDVKLVNINHIVSYDYNIESYPGKHTIKDTYPWQEIPRNGEYIVLLLSNNSTIVIDSMQWNSFNPVDRETLAKYDLEFNAFINKLINYFSNKILEL